MSGINIWSVYSSRFNCRAAQAVRYHGLPWDGGAHVQVASGILSGDYNKFFANEKVRARPPRTTLV